MDILYPTDPLAGRKGARTGEVRNRRNKPQVTTTDIVALWGKKNTGDLRKVVPEASAGSGLFFLHRFKLGLVGQRHIVFYPSIVERIDHPQF